MGTARLRGRVVAVVVGVLIAISTLPRPALAANRTGHAGRWLTDDDGRVLIVHGVNVPTKWQPLVDPAVMGFDDDDVKLLQTAGLNAVRLTVERYVAAPTPDRFDDAYLDGMAATVRRLAAAGIYSIIDFHQDEWGPVFFDNGFPEWMTMTDGLPNLYQVGFPFQYFLNPAVNRAFDHFWQNDVGPSGRRLQDDDAAILSHVVARFRGLPNVLGYEIINEPWPGSQYPTCVVPFVGCPLFDRGPFSAYYARVIAKMRAADTDALIWYEPLTIFNEGVPTSVRPPRDPALGFAFHNYPLCGAPNDQLPAETPALPTPPCRLFDDVVLANAEAHAEKTHNALLLTEFGASTDIGRVSEQLDSFDRHAMPWLFWSYQPYVVPTVGNGVLAPASAPNVVVPMLTALARPYPQRVAGTPTSWRFDPTTRSFTLRYSTSRAGSRGRFRAGAETVISTPSLVYPAGYRVRVTNGRVVSAPNAPLLRIEAADRARAIVVKITRL